MHNKRTLSGFSLLEIMIGMVIGLLGTIVVMQVFSMNESRNRTTTSGDDAQNSAAIALYGLQRDIQQSGYGITAAKIIGCNVQLRAGVTLNVMAPVTINHASIPAGDANTDTLLIVYGSSNSSAEGDGISAQPGNGAVYTVQTPASFVANDRVVSEAQARPNPCNLTMDQVVSVDIPNSAVTVATGVANMSNGTLFNLGQTPKVTAYAIRNGNLTMCKLVDINTTTLADDGKNCTDATLVNDQTVWIPIGSGIVNMRAQYGRDTNTLPMDGIVDVYDQTTPTTACGWTQTAAVRLALVAKSAKQEPQNVTAAAPSWAGVATQPIDLTKNPDGSANANWQRYRYKTFEALVPLRNVTWQGVVSGC
ncbi:MAG TPA: PilW family protein [Methylophilaceae bacterium]|nr:PilW family protein [Methylophilaceae bacterium]